MAHRKKRLDVAAGKDPRSRILAAAIELVRTGDEASVTTRAVAAAADVQAPTIYRLFGDKDGLLEAVSEQAVEQFVAQLLPPQPGNQVEVQRRAFEAYVAWGLKHPIIFAFMSRSGAANSKAWQFGLGWLRDSLRRIALEGRLKVTEEHAMDMWQAMGDGAIVLIQRSGLKSHDQVVAAAREAAVAATIADGKARKNSKLTTAAATLRASLAAIPTLSPGETALMDELLRRIIEQTAV